MVVEVVTTHAEDAVASGKAVTGIAGEASVGSGKVGKLVERERKIVRHYMYIQYIQANADEQERQIVLDV